MKIKKNKGFTLIELVVVMALMAILGIIIGSALKAGGSLYWGIHEDYDGQSEARVAMAYITTKLRENDTEAGVELTADKQGFRIKDSSSQFKYEIYFEGNKLKEKQIADSSKQIDIANIDSLNIEIVEKTYINSSNIEIVEKNLKITVGYLKKNKVKASYEEILALKCALQ